MRIVNRYLLRQIAVPCLLGVSAIAVVGIGNELQMQVKQLPVEQMTFGDLSRLAFYFLPTLVVYIVPITYMTGILLAFGRLSQNNELVAMKAAGIPLRQIVLPVILIGALLSGACFWVQDRVQPWAIGKVTDFVYSDLPLRMTLDALPTGIMQDFAGWRVYIGKKDDHTGEFKDIVILKPEENGRATTYYADSARLVKEKDRSFLDMTGVHLIPPGESGYVARLQTNTARLAIPKVSALRPSVPRRGLTLEKLRVLERDLSEQVASTHSEPLKLELRRVRQEVAERLSLPFACLAVTFAAAPLGARAKRSGRSYTFATGFAIIVVYYVLQTVMEPKQLAGLNASVLRAWLPNIVLCLAGVGFLWKVDRV